MNSDAIVERTLCGRFVVVGALPTSAGFSWKRVASSLELLCCDWLAVHLYIIMYPMSI